MKAVTQYQASDGSQFRTVEECESYERLQEQVLKAMEPLGAKPIIGHGKWVQHSPEACIQAKRNLVAIAKEQFKSGGYPVLKNNPDDIHPSSILGRIIDDSGIHCLNEAWYRLMCINFDNYREYDQPFFANNPNQAEK